MTAIRVFSFGGGWQSTAALVLQAEGKLDFDAFLFANVGDDSEKPETLAYVHQYAMPFAVENGIRLIEVKRQWKDQREFESIYAKILNAPEGKLREPIPVRGENGKPLSRSCTMDWKILATGLWCKEHGASKDNPGIKALGYTLDEVSRVNPNLALPYEILTYPLIGAPAGHDTGLRLRRSDCPRIIRAAGLPVPPKSHCWFCPFHSIEEWHTERRDYPDRFAKSVGLEALMNKRRDKLDKQHVYLTRFGRPLDQVVREGVDLLPIADLDEDGEACDAGGCFT
jgi:hypothetical protein